MMADVRIAKVLSASGLPIELSGDIPLTDEVVNFIMSALLPAEAPEYGWNEAMVRSRWTGNITGTVRLYWLMRVNDTASYINISEPGGSFQLTQQHSQAKAMLDYWDKVILLDKEHARKFAPASVGTVKARRRGSGSSGSCC